MFASSKLPLFHDLYHIRAPYFNQYFWQMVQENWKDEIFGAGSSVCEKVMGRTLDNLKTIINDNNALNLLYSGYSWNTTFSNSPTLYQYTYSNGAGNAANMHKTEYKKISKNVMTGIGITLNCVDQYKNNSWDNEAFFGDNQPRFIFRFATGKELLGSTPSVYASIATVDERIKDVYVFNDIQDVPVGPQTEPKIYTEADATGTQTLKNKTVAADPVYLPGDVLMDEEGARWFCIHTSNNSSMTSQCRDSLAWFVSFEGVETSEDDKVATNILTEEDLPFFAYYWAQFYSSAANTKPNKEYKPLDLETNQLGDLGEHIKKYADIDIRDIVLQRDSTWRFYSKGKWYDSPSTGNRFWNIAYSDGRTDRQPVARMIFDYTQAGNSRGDCYGSDGKKYMDFFWRLYKHYETYDPARITLNQVQKDFGMTEWNGTWPITSRLIFLQDLSDDLQVRGHAYPDKWTRLGYYKDGSHIDKATERTTVETDCKVSDYVLSKDQRTPRKGMWNEPVLIVRLMKVKDNGGNVPNLTSTDGRKLRVVHLRDSEAIYKFRPHVSAILGIPAHTSLCFFLDNQLYKLPKIPGMEQFYTE